MRQNEWLGRVTSLFNIKSFKIVLAFALVLVLSSCTFFGSTQTPRPQNTSLYSPVGSAKPIATKTPSTTPISSDAQFKKLTNDFFIEMLKDDPISVNFLLAHPEKYGLEKIVVNTNSGSNTSEDNTYDLIAFMQKRLKAIPVANLNKDNAWTYEILQDWMTRQLSLKPYDLLQTQLGSYLGYNSQIIMILPEYKFRTEKDIKDYLQILKGISSDFKGIIEHEKLRAEKGLLAPKSVLNGAIEQCQNFKDKGGASYLITSFDDRIKQVGFLSNSQKKTYSAQNKNAINTVVIPAYQNLATEIKKLVPKSKNQMGLCYLPKGKAYYETLFKEQTASDDSIENVKANLEANLKQIMNRATTLAIRGRFFSEEDMKRPIGDTDPSKNLDYFAKKMIVDFPTPPQIKYALHQVDQSIQENSPPAWYMDSPIDDTETEIIYTNPAKMQDANSLYLTLSHEGFPGHLFQHTYFKSKGPNPIRFIMSFGGYTEGYASYVEKFAATYSPKDATLAEFLYINQAYGLTLQALIDIGIHYDGWDLNQLKGFCKKYGIPESADFQKIYDQVVETPTDSVKYCYGEYQIEQLSILMKKLTEGENSTKEFHTFFLNCGPAPFALIQKRMVEQYAKAQSAA